MIPNDPQRPLDDAYEHSQVDGMKSETIQAFNESRSDEESL